MDDVPRERGSEGVWIPQSYINISWHTNPTCSITSTSPQIQTEPTPNQTKQLPNITTPIKSPVINTKISVSHVPFPFPSLPFVSSPSYPPSYPQTSLHLPKSQHHELRNIKSSQIKSWHEKNPRPSANQGRIVDACMY